MVYIPAELLVEILLRLPWTSRRRMRLVCRSWRDLVHQRTTEMQECRDAAPLVATTEAAYVLDEDDDDDLDNSKTVTPRQLWPPIGSGGGRSYRRHMEVVGACNGVICLCDDSRSGGAITLANPATGDVLALPPIPCDGLFRRHNTRRPGRSWHQAYSFGFHHATGQYKVVHVPCFFKTKETLQVFTLGEASWREVPAPGARCRLDAGIVSMIGATYWVTEEGSNEKIMFFDLRSEQVRSTKPLPVSARRPICQLTQVHRRLAAATSDQIYGYATIEVWVLESTGKGQTWTHQYSLRCRPSLRLSIQLGCPNYVYTKYNLMFGTLEEQGPKLFGSRHKPANYVSSSECRVFYIDYRFRKPLDLDIRGDICRTFAYFKTTQALSVYRRW